MQSFEDGIGISISDLRWQLISFARCITWKGAISKCDMICMDLKHKLQSSLGLGGTDLGRWYGDVRPWRPPFHASTAVHKGPISSKWVSSQAPLLSEKKMEILASTASIFAQILALKPPNLEIFCSQAHPLFRGIYQFASPTLRKSGPHTPTWKKVECLPPGELHGRWTVAFIIHWLCVLFVMKEISKIPNCVGKLWSLTFWFRNSALMSHKNVPFSSRKFLLIIKLYYNLDINYNLWPSAS